MEKPTSHTGSKHGFFPLTRPYPGSGRYPCDGLAGSRSWTETSPPGGGLEIELRECRKPLRRRTQRMKKILYIVLAAAIVAGVCAFCLDAFSQCRAAAFRHPALRRCQSSLGCREELGLTDSQFAEVKKLHAAYLASARPCARALPRLTTALTRQPAANPHHSGAYERYPRTRGSARPTANRKCWPTFYETSQLMDEKQAKKYLDVMLPLRLGLQPQRAGRRPCPLMVQTMPHSWSGSRRTTTTRSMS